MQKVKHWKSSLSDKSSVSPYRPVRQTPYLPHPRVRYWADTHVPFHPCQSREQCPAAVSSIYFRQVGGFKAVSPDQVGLPHSCFPPGQTHPCLQKVFIFRQLLSCTTSPHNCQWASGRAGGKITRLVGRGESTLDWDEIMLLPLLEAALTQEMRSCT